MMDGDSMTVEKRHAVQLIQQYLRKRNPWPRYYNEEKDTLYRFVIAMAIRDIRTADDAPLNVLYDSLRKYDNWAHKNGKNSGIYSVAISAVDDLIDCILSAN